MADGPRVGFLFLGGAHQMLHIAPVAAELARMGGCAVRLLATSPADRDRLDALMTALGAPMPVDMLPDPVWLGWLASARRRPTRPKRLQLLTGRRMIGDLDLLVTAERTSTFLKRLPGPVPRLVHIPHGAGDRDQGFEPRLRLFDHVIAAGPKDRDRMVGDGLVAAEDISVSGYVKLSAVLRMRARAAAPRPFDNDRPTVLYNPHFEPSLSSWRMFGAAFGQAAARMTDHNFILAPHLRLAEHLSARERRAVEALREPGRVIVDLGSERSCDMSYTLAADIYVGDVSSQVYEYLHVPKPCLFLNATGRDQAGNRDFAFWRFGEVLRDPDAIEGAIRRAPERHAGFVATQRAGVRDALGPFEANAAAEAAKTVARLACAGA